MRHIKLTGREVSVVRAMGFAEAIVGSEIIDHTRMQAEDVADTLNGMMSAGFIESIPYREEVPPDEVAGMSFEINPAYAGELRSAMLRRF